MVVLTSFTQPTDGIRHRQNNTTVYVNDNNIGKGTLFIAESCLSWVSDAGNGFSLEYPHISLHAVSRDLSAFPQECLFLMLDTALGDEEASNGNGENGDNENESGSDQETTELRLVPDDRGMLDAMFHAMNVCQALHPDPEDSFSDEDFYEDADDEIPMEEADYRMAGLRIESTDGRPRIGRGVAAAVDMEEDTEEDMEEDMEGDRVVGTPGSTSVGVGRVGAGTVVGMVGGMVAGAGGSQGGVPLVGGRVVAAGGSQGEVPLEGGRVAEVEGSQGEVPLEGGRVAEVVDKAVGRAAGRAVDRVVDTLHTLEGRVVDMAVDMVEDKAVDMVEGRAVDTLYTSGGRVVGMAEGTLDTWGGRVVDMVEDKAVDMVEGRAAGTLYTSVGRAGDRVVGILGTAAVGRAGGRVVGTLGTAAAEDMGRDGRSFSSGSIWRQGISAVPPPAYSPRTAPPADHNFDDAEN